MTNCAFYDKSMTFGTVITRAKLNFDYWILLPRNHIKIHISLVMGNRNILWINKIHGIYITALRDFPQNDMDC